MRRRGPEASWLFLLNHTGSAQRVPTAGIDLLTGAVVEDAVTLPAGGVAVVRERAGA
ncbi:Beta-galactosidase C-terminal domain [Micromonospora echinospora]|uniref:Beta-galactosidase C-terminal domain n=1 Tax=Micromonospora echinospora TaxID=1877 RepID=UPI003A89D80F